MVNEWFKVRMRVINNLNLKVWIQKEEFSRQTSRKGTEYNIAAYVSHILNMSTPHMPLFKIGVTFFEYAAWLYSGMIHMWWFYIHRGLPCKKFPKPQASPVMLQFPFRLSVQCLSVHHHTSSHFLHPGMISISETINRRVLGRLLPSH